MISMTMIMIPFLDMTQQMKTSEFLHSCLMRTKHYSFSLCLDDTSGEISVYVSCGYYLIRGRVCVAESLDG